MVRLWLSGGADINQTTTDDDSATPLFIASQMGHVDVIDLLLSGGANLEQGIRSGWSPLFVAAWSGHVGAANLLLEAGANNGVAATAAHLDVAAGSTPLTSATDMGHSAVEAALHGAADNCGSP
jgi:ankyrin repeat protein